MGFSRSSCVGAWERFKWLVECPGQEKGLRRQVGIVLYICCLLAALVLAIAMFQGSQSTHVSYKSEGSDGTSSFKHRLPDFVTCPREVQSPKTEHNVHLNPETVTESGISYREIDQLATMHRKSCALGTACDISQMEVPCEGTAYQKFCENLHNFYSKDPLYPKFNPDNLRKRREEQPQNHHQVLLNQVSAVAILYEKNNGRWTLHMLWLSIIFSGYNPIQNIVSEKYSLDTGRSGINCYYYHNTERQGVQEDKEGMLRQQETTQTMWVGKSLCLVQLGSFFPEKSVPFYGCRNFIGNFKYIAHFPNMWPPFRYWFGDLSTSVLKEDAFYLSMATNPSYTDTVPRRVNSGIVHYNSITVADETKTRKDCVTQPIVRGLEIPCIQTKGKVVTWNYDVTTQTRQLSTIWIYGDTKLTLERKPTFTFYTKLTFGAGIFGCLMGMSMAQILEISMILLKKCFREKFKHGLQAFKYILLLFLVLGSTSLTIWDTLSYTEGRYTPIFTEKNSELEIPAWKLCPDFKIDSSFLNVTKFYEHNVSLQLYGYLKLAGVFRHPVMKIISKNQRFENGTYVKEVPAWMIQNVKPSVRAVSHCQEDMVFCENWPEVFYLGTYFPPPNRYFKPRLFEAGKRRAFLEQMNLEMRVLEKKLGLPRNSPIHEVFAKFFLDPSQLISACRARNTNVPNCGQYAKYTYYGNAQFCLSVTIPESAMRAEKSYGYRQGLSVTLDHVPFLDHGDYYSYYGPGTQEMRQMYLKDTRCYKRDGAITAASEAKGYRSEDCSYGSGYSFRMQIPSYSTSELDYRVHPLLPPTAFVAEVRTGFTQNQLDSECQGEQPEPVCKHPNEEMAALYMAIYMTKECGCSFCHGTDFRQTAKDLSRASEILGSQAHCCLDTEYFSCYSRIIENVDWQKKRDIYKKYMEDEKIKEIGNTDFTYTHRYNYYRREFWKDPNFIIFKDFLRGSPHIAEKDMKEVDRTSIKKLFQPHILDKLDDSLLERLVNFTRKCYQKTCKIENLELVNIQPQEPGVNKSYITIFYSTPKTHGMKLVDLFDPVQFVATLLAGYSVTLGISLIGLSEIITLLIKNWNSTDGVKNVSKTGTRHILRSLSLVFSSKMKRNDIQPQKDTKNSDEAQRDSLGINDDPISVQRNLAAVEESGDARKEFQDRSNDNYKRAKSQADSMRSGKFVDGKKPNDLIVSKESRNWTVVEPRKNTKSIQNESRQSYVDHCGSILLLAFLVFFFCASVFCVAYFFLSFANEQFDGQVAEAAFYERPSTIICVENENLVDALLKGIADASCTTSKGTTACDNFFETFLRSQESRFCVMEDNSRKMHKGDETKEDLIMKVTDNFPSVVIGGISFNESSSLDMIYPFSVWKKDDALLSYTMTLSESETSSCIKSIPLKPCMRCPSNPRIIQSPALCCFHPKEHEPAIPKSQTCSNFQFGIKVTSKPKDQDALGRTLSVIVSKRNMLVYASRVKYSFVYYLSIVGGFFGAFVELTILNIVAAVCIAAINVIKKFKGSRKEAVESG